MVVLVSIYSLIDPRDGRVRYVGKTEKDLSLRFSQHLNSTARRPVVHWIQKLDRVGLVPDIVLLECVDLSDWQEAERRWIAYWKSFGCRLLNMTEGGEGSVKGVKRSMETRRRMSESQRGKKHSLETVEKIRKAHLGRRHSEECREKHRILARKQWREGRGHEDGRLTIGEVTKTIPEWADESGISPQTVYSRLRKGCPPGRAVIADSYVPDGVKTNQKKAWETRRKMYGVKGRKARGKYSEGQQKRYSKKEVLCQEAIEGGG